MSFFSLRYCLFITIINFRYAALGIHSQRSCFYPSTVYTLSVYSAATLNLIYLLIPPFCCQCLRVYLICPLVLFLYIAHKWTPTVLPFFCLYLISGSIMLKMASFNFWVIEHYFFVHIFHSCFIHSNRGRWNHAGFFILFPKDKQWRNFYMSLTIGLFSLVKYLFRSSTYF